MVNRPREKHKSEPFVNPVELLNLILFAGQLAVSILAYEGYFFDDSLQDLLDKNETRISPNGNAGFIWLLVYTFQLVSTTIYNCCMDMMSFVSLSMVNYVMNKNRHFVCDSSSKPVVGSRSKFCFLAAVFSIPHG